MILVGNLYIFCSDASNVPNELLGLPESDPWMIRREFSGTSIHARESRNVTWTHIPRHTHSRIEDRLLKIVVLPDIASVSKCCEYLNASLDDVAERERRPSNRVWSIQGYKRLEESSKVRRTCCPLTIPDTGNIIRAVIQLRKQTNGNDWGMMP
jgi:hypothetical protein